MPGVDWLLAAFARIGLITLWANPDNAPSTGNVATTVWLKVSSTDWAAEGTVYLWDSDAEAFAPATPVLWSRLLGATFAVAREMDPDASRTLTSADLGLLFTNRNSAVIEYTLPVASTVDGGMLEFLTTQNGLLTIALADGDTQLNWGGDSTTISIAGAQIGAYLKLRSVNGQWFVISGDGEWLLQ
jgi:hypothetical protein